MFLSSGDQVAQSTVITTYRDRLGFFVDGPCADGRRVVYVIVFVHGYLHAYIIIIFIPYKARARARARDDR